MRQKGCLSGSCTAASVGFDTLITQQCPLDLKRRLRGIHYAEGHLHQVLCQLESAVTSAVITEGFATVPANKGEKSEVGKPREESPKVDHGVKLHETARWMTRMTMRQRIKAVREPPQSAAAPLAPSANIPSPAPTAYRTKEHHSICPWTALCVDNLILLCPEQLRH
jgi:hypothetical protein